MGAMDVTLQERFRENVNHLLVEKCISRSELARMMNAKPQYVTDYLNGRISPGLNVIVRFADALGVDPLSLLCEPATV
jgi:transcriptional regulator with XRE-family HTH domain